MEILTKSFGQDPQSNLSISINDGLCEASFFLWDLDSQEITTHKGKLIFYDCWAIEYLGVEIHIHAGSKELCLPNIFLNKIRESQWFASKIQQRAKTYPTWPVWDKTEYVHYLLEGHDHHIQIIASAFEFQIISGN